MLSSPRFICSRMSAPDKVHVEGGTWPAFVYRFEGCPMPWFHSRLWRGNRGSYGHLLLFVSDRL
jgi:hypothetical protein